MALDFIFMLTRNDRTVSDAAIHLQTAIAAGVRHIGFKDVGLAVAELKTLNDAIREGRATSYLEVVSLDRDSEIASARAAVEIGVDCLMGGTRAGDVLPVIAGMPIRYYPFPGRVSGHPSILEGSVAEIAASAAELAGLGGVHGLDLLAYRSKVGGPALIAAVCEAAAGKPVVVAGSIADPAGIRSINEAGAAGFTIGTAALDGRFPASAPGLEGQLAAIQKTVAEIENRLSSHKTVNLAAAFASFDEAWAPRIAGRINSMQLKLAKFAGAFVWHHHEAEDELFLVNKGRLLMKLRDRDEIVEAGEFIIVPAGVEHCPVALTEPCEVLLLEPATTVNTGSAGGALTRAMPGKLRSGFPSGIA